MNGLQRQWRAAIIVAACSVIVACGFRLQGASSWPTEWAGYRVESRLQGIDGEDFIDALQLELEQRGVQRGVEPVAVIRLLNLGQRKIVSALDARGQAAEFELQRRVEFRIIAGGRTSPPLAVIAQRRLSFDPNLALAKQQEEAQIIRALTRELTDLLLLRVEAELRAVSAVSAGPPRAEGVSSAE